MLRSTSRVVRSRAFTPMTRALASKPGRASSSAWTSTRAVMPTRLGSVEQRHQRVHLERGHDQQDQVGPVGAGLPQLVGATTKSLRSTGIRTRRGPRQVLQRPAEPRRSVSTLITGAARRKLPLEVGRVVDVGHRAPGRRRRLTSAMTPTPSALSAARALERRRGFSRRGFSNSPKARRATGARPSLRAPLRGSRRAQDLTAGSLAVSKNRKCCATDASPCCYFRSGAGLLWVRLRRPSSLRSRGAGCLAHSPRAASSAGFFSRLSWGGVLLVGVVLGSGSCRCSATPTSSSAVAAPCFAVPAGHCCCGVSSHRPGRRTGRHIHRPVRAAQRRGQARLRRPGARRGGPRRARARRS